MEGKSGDESGHEQPFVGYGVRSIVAPESQQYRADREGRRRRPGDLPRAGELREFLIRVLVQLALLGLHLGSRYATHSRPQR
jgi:hypothetical protein